MAKISTDLEQSKKLAEILPIDSADMYFDYNGEDKEYYPIVMNKEDFDELCIPAWSLSSLLTIIMKQLYNKEMCFFSLKVCFNGDYYIDSAVHTTKLHKDAIDACVEIILVLKEKGLL